MQMVVFTDKGCIPPNGMKQVADSECMNIGRRCEFLLEHTPFSGTFSASNSESALVAMETLMRLAEVLGVVLRSPAALCDCASVIWPFMAGMKAGEDLGRFACFACCFGWFR